MQIISTLIVALLLSGCASELPRLHQPVSVIELRSEGNELQAHQYSCGAASLATLMSTLGQPTSEQELLEKILPTKTAKVIDKNIEIEPLSIKDLEDLSRWKGFKVVSLTTPDEQNSYRALSELGPVITRMKIYNEILHFVVVRSVHDGWVYIGDPGYGNIRVPWGQFYNAFDDAGRMFVAISKEPFMAKVFEETGALALKRRDDFTPSEHASEQPKELFNMTNNTIRFSNTF